MGGQNLARVVQPLFIFFLRGQLDASAATIGVTPEAITRMDRRNRGASWDGDTSLSSREIDWPG